MSKHLGGLPAGLQCRGKRPVMESRQMADPLQSHGCAYRQELGDGTLLCAAGDTVGHEAKLRDCTTTTTRAMLGHFGEDEPYSSDLELFHLISNIKGVHNRIITVKHS